MRKLMDECNVFVLGCGCRWVLTEKQKRTIESLIQREQKDPKEKSANDWAECYLKGSAASAHAKMMNATSSSHANRKVDGDMERLPCRGCGGWISYPNFSCPAGSDNGYTQPDGLHCQRSASDLHHAPSSKS